MMTKAHRHLTIALVGLVFACLAIACLPGAATAEYRMHSGDVMEIAVVGFPDVSKRASVQADGSTSFPVIGRLRVAGLTVEELEERLMTEFAKRLLGHRLASGREPGSMIQPGDVTVNIAEYGPIYVTGDVLTPNQYSFRPLMTVRHAIAQAGGVSAVRIRSPLQYDPIDLERDFKSLSLEFAKEVVNTRRLKAEKDGRVKVNSTQAPDLAIDDKTFADLIQGANELLAANRADLDHERKFLQHAVVDAENEVTVIEKQRIADQKATDTEVNEKTFVERLVQEGTAARPRSLESRRAVSDTASRQTQTNISLAQAHMRLNELRSRLERLDGLRQIALVRELTDARLHLADVGVKLSAIIEKSRLGGSTASLARRLPLEQPEFFVFRKTETSSQRMAADEDTELQPGDVVEVSLRSAQLAGANTR